MQLRLPDQPYSPDLNYNITDLYHSLYWKERVLDNETIMANPRNVLLSLSTDGFCPFKKRIDSIWPLMGCILNLPESIRNHPSNMLIYGLVPGPTKPASMDPYLSILVNSLLESEDIGITIEDSSCGLQFNILARILFTSADNPAMCLLNNQQGSNAEVGCHKCYVVGRHDRRAGTQIYQVNGSPQSSFINEETKELQGYRTHQHYLDNASRAIVWQKFEIKKYVDDYQKRVRTNKLKATDQAHVNRGYLIINPDKLNLSSK